MIITFTEKHEFDKFMKDKVFVSKDSHYHIFEENDAFNDAVKIQFDDRNDYLTIEWRNPNYRLGEYITLDKAYEIATWKLEQAQEHYNKMKKMKTKRRTK